MNKKTYKHKNTSLEETDNNKVKFSLRKLKTFDSFKVRGFRIFYLAMAGQWASQSMQMMVRSLLVYRITGEEIYIGLLALGQSVPILMVSLLGGTFADRVQKKYILVGSQMTSAIISIAVGVALSLGWLNEGIPGSWWLLMLSAVLQGTVMGIMAPSRIAIIPEIVGDEQVMNAISLTSMGQTIFRIIGPALSGFLIAAYDFEAVYYLMSVMYILGTVFACLLPRTKAVSNRKISVLSDMKEGLSYLRREPTFMIIVIFGLCHTIAGQPYMQLMAVFADDILNKGEVGLGILTSVSGVGALLGSIVIASLPNKKRGLILLLSGVVMGLPIMVFAFSRWWYLSLFMMPFAGLGPIMHITMTNTLIQYYADPEYRGRTQSFLTMAMHLSSFGTFFAALLSGVMGIQWSVGGMALLLTVVSVWLIVFSSRIRKLE